MNRILLNNVPRLSNTDASYPLPQPERGGGFHRRPEAEGGAPGHHDAPGEAAPVHVPAAQICQGW